MKALKSIIIEGPDGAGKSSLINTIAPYNTEIIHNGVYKNYNDAFNVYRHQIMAANKARHLFIFDRSYISEIIYGKIIRGYDVPEYEITSIESEFLNLSTLVIFCLPPYDVAFKNWNTRNLKGKEYIKKSTIYRQAYNMYELISKTIGLPSIRCDYTDIETFNIELIRRLLS